MDDSFDPFSAINAQPAMVSAVTDNERRDRRYRPVRRYAHP